MHDETTSAFTAGPRTGEASTDDPPARLRRGTTVDRYIVIDRLGGGGMGDVYSAWDEDLRRRVALKIIRPREGTDVRSRVLAEARALARLHHPHVVSVHDVGEDADAVFVSMTLLEGRDLRTWASDDAPALASQIQVIVQCAEGLAAAHAAGLVHHDVKPSNVMVELRSGAPWAWLIDFGLATDRESAGGLRGGTRAYMAPERRDGQRGDAASDQWSLALMAAELIGGARPSLEEALAGELRACGRATPALRRALRRDPALRHDSVEAFSAALRRATRPRTWRWVFGAALAVAAGRAATSMLEPAAPSCEAQAHAQLEASGGVHRVEVALGRWGDTAPALREPVRRQLDVWRGAWASELTEQCRTGAPLESTCRDAQIEAWIATVDAVTMPETSAEGRWTLMAEIARLAGPCIEESATQPAEAQVRALQVAHLPDRALALARATLDELAPDSSARPRLLGRMASIHRTLNDPERSLALADEAMLLAGQRGDAHTLARTAIERAYTLVQMGRFDGAADAVRVARPLVAMTEDSPDLLATALDAKARVHEVRFEMEAAQATFERSLALKQQVAPGSIQEADTRRALGNVLAQAGDCDAAIPHLSTAIERYQQQFGADSPAEAEALQGLGSCELESGKVEQGLASVRRSSEIIAATIGPRSIERAMALVYLGDMLNKIGRKREAGPLYRESADIKREVLGPRHRETVIAKLHVGWHLLSLDELDSAREILEEVLDVAESVPELDEVDWTQIEGARAAWREAEGDLEGAYAAQRRSVEHLRVGMADMPHTWIIPLTNLASLEVRLGKIEPARRTYAEAEQLARALPQGVDRERSLEKIHDAVASLPPPRRPPRGSRTAQPDGEG